MTALQLAASRTLRKYRLNEARLVRQGPLSARIVFRVHPVDHQMSSHEVAGSDPGSSHNLLELPSLQPLSHDHPLLAAPEFDADGFLLSRLDIPLEELRGELREYLGVLREELVQLINDDYEEFISLGTGLRGENSRLASLQAPLSALIEQVQVSRACLAQKTSLYR